MTSDLPSRGQRYRHYKGGLYEVIEIAKHTESGEQIVVYVNVKHQSVWARPYTEWLKPVEGQPDIKRFAKIPG